MKTSMNLTTPRSPWRAAIVAVAAFALLAPHAPASGGDGDEDGVLPKHGGGSEQLTSGTVGLAYEDLGVDQIDATQACVELSAVEGPTILDTSVAPESAVFLPDGPIDYSATEDAVCLQADGKLLLQDGLKSSLKGAPDAAARGAYLLLTAADADLHAVLAGTQAPTVAIALGDMAGVDLGALQKLVDNHAGKLQGMKVSLVLLSLDGESGLHKAAAGLKPGAQHIEIVQD